MEAELALLPGSKAVRVCREDGVQQARVAQTQQSPTSVDSLGSGLMLQHMHGNVQLGSLAPTWRILATKPGDRV